MKNILLIIAFVAGINIVSIAQVSVVVNKSVTESANAQKVALIYSLDATKWSNGSKVVVFDNSSEASSSFYKGIGKDLLTLKKEWMKKQLTGEAKAPLVLGSDADVIAKVSSTPGAIGYVKSNSVNPSVNVLLELK